MFSQETSFCTRQPPRMSLQNTLCEFPLLVNLWVQQQQQQQARPACYSYLNSLLYQNHTAGWMSQGFVLLRKAIQLTEGKKKKETHRHSPEGQQISERKLKTAAENQLEQHKHPSTLFMLELSERRVVNISHHLRALLNKRCYRYRPAAKCASL